MNTHLETEDFPAVQQAQAAEFLAGPGKGGTIIATGDFNSASDGSTTTSYAQLTAPGKFRDAWDEDELGSGSSCCQESNTPPLAPGALNNPDSTLRTRIDLILSRGAARSDWRRGRAGRGHAVPGGPAVLALRPRGRGRQGPAERLERTGQEPVGVRVLPIPGADCGPAIATMASWSNGRP